LAWPTRITLSIWLTLPTSCPPGSLHLQPMKHWYHITAQAVTWSLFYCFYPAEDLGLSAAGGVARSGLMRLTSEVALGHVGLV
jgi:hypothetical protein